MSDTKKKRVFDPLMLLIIIGAAVVGYLELFPPAYSEDETVNTLIRGLITRCAGTVIFIPVAIRSKYKVYGFTSDKKTRALLVSIPALLVVVNNLPIIGLVSGNAVLLRSGAVLWLYAAESFSIGLFEELAFRAVLFPAVLEKHRASTKDIFWYTVLSSAVFGGIHLFNLFAGAGVGPVVLQIGYSFLIGGMCAVVLLKTRCIWLCVLLHTLFDFNGYLIPTLGDGIIWDAATVTVTAVLGVLTLIHFLFVMKNVRPEDLERIYG